jgi:hypothetical protein
MGISKTAEDRRREAERAAWIEQANATFDERMADQLDPTSPNYIGPGYENLGNKDEEGLRVLTLTDPLAHDSWRLQQNAPAPTNPQQNTEDLVSEVERMAGGGAPAAPARPQPTNAEIAAGRGTAPTLGVGSRATAVTRAPPASPVGAPATIDKATADKLASVQAAAPPGAAGSGALPSRAPAPAPTTDGAPQINRDAVNAALAPVNQIGGMLTAEALQNRSAGLAEAQLRESTARARAAALGAARSGNRRDRVQLERQAIGEGTFIEQEGGRQAATLRAQEELQNRQFRVDTLTKAGELGLNVAAYEVDLSKANLQSASQWVQQQFEQLGLDKQLDMQLVLEKMGLAEQRYATDTQAGIQEKQLAEQRFQNLLGFTRDMAAIQLEYDQLSVEDQNEADRLMMQKYQIDQETMVALKEIKQKGKFRWDNVLSGVAGGFGMGATGMIGKAIGL